MHLAISQNSYINCKLFPSQRQDCKTIEQVWCDWDWSKIKFVVADKGYDTGNIRRFITLKNATAVIPYKGIWAHEDSLLTPKDFYDTKMYRTRHIIERFFGRIKENKRVATRFDKLDHTFLSFVLLSIAKLYKLFC